jgi:hypothetical protein
MPEKNNDAMSPQPSGVPAAFCARWRRQQKSKREVRQVLHATVALIFEVLGKSAWDDLQRRREIGSRCLTYLGMINRDRICWGNEERRGVARK